MTQTGFLVMVLPKDPPLIGSHDSLWDFALRFYRQPGVEQACLQLQDQWGADVTLLLWLCWLERRKVRVSAADIKLGEQAVARWQADVVVPLRGLRRQIKAEWSLDDVTVQTVRATVQQAELQAERTALQWLEALEVGAQEDVTRGTHVQLYLAQLAVPADIAGDLLIRLTLDKPDQH